jgi:hypothetical protein
MTRITKRVKIIKVTDFDYELEIYHYGDKPYTEEYDDHTELTERVQELKDAGYIIVNDHFV